MERVVGKVLCSCEREDTVGYFFFSSRRRHTRWNCDWSSDVCSSDLATAARLTYDGGVSADVVDFFRKRFRAAGSPERAKSEKAYMKSALDFHGVDAATVRAACAEYVEAHALDHDALVAAVDALYATGWFDLHSAAIGILERKRKLVATGDAEWLIALVRRSACWAHVDWLATKIVPQALPPSPGKL